MKERRIDKEHPDYKVFETELEALVLDFNEQSKSLASKSKGIQLVADLVPIRKEFFAKVKSLQDKYSYLYK